MQRNNMSLFDNVTELDELVLTVAENRGAESFLAAIQNQIITLSDGSQVGRTDPAAETLQMIDNTYATVSYKAGMSKADLAIDLLGYDPEQEAMLLWRLQQRAAPDGCEVPDETQRLWQIIEQQSRTIDHLLKG